MKVKSVSQFGLISLVLNTGLLVSSAKASDLSKFSMDVYCQGSQYAYAHKTVITADGRVLADGKEMKLPCFHRSQ